jgi:hypothetical protein
MALFHLAKWGFPEWHGTRTRQKIIKLFLQTFIFGPANFLLCERKKEGEKERKKERGKERKKER